MGLVFSAASSVASSVATCLGITLGNCFCQGVKSCLPVGYTPAKFYALLLFFASVVAAIILRTTQPSIDTGYFKVECTGQYADRCMGYQAVYRLSFVDFFFFLAIALGSKFHVNVHSNLWGLKYLVFLGSTFGMFFVKNEVFDGYLHLARIASLFYLVAQLVALVNFSYQVHAILIAKRDAAATSNDENTVKFWEGVYLGTCVLLQVAALVGIGLLYAYWGACRVSQFWISITLIAGLVCSVCAVLDQVQVGLLTPSFLFLYFDYMCWSAILSNPDSKCNPLADMPGATQKTWNTVVSLLFLALSLTYTAFSTYQTFTGSNLSEEEARGSINAASGSTGMDPKMRAILTGEEGAATAPATQASEEGRAGQAAAVGMTATEVVESEYIWIFHLFMALAGAYMAMAITNWGNGSGVPEAGDTTVGVESMWVKICSQWLCIILFLITEWAPYMRGEAPA